jgi:hypothetical protein
VQVLVGYFQSKDQGFLAPPNLETDATGNDFGQAEVKITNALSADGLPLVNVHSYSFKAGKNKLVLGKGKVLVLGFVDENVDLKNSDSRKGKATSSVDWLFE